MNIEKRHKGDSEKDPQTDKWKSNRETKEMEKTDVQYVYLEKHIIHMYVTSEMIEIIIRLTKGFR